MAHLRSSVTTIMTHDTLFTALAGICHCIGCILGVLLTVYTMAQAFRDRIVPRSPRNPIRIRPHLNLGP